MNDITENYVCQKCGKVFIDWKKFKFHEGWHFAEEKFLEKIKLKKENDTATKCERKFICYKCGKEFTMKLTDNDYEKFLKNHNHFYCSKSCANSKKHSEESKAKIKESLKKYFANKEHKQRMFICKKCGIKYIFDKDLNPGSTAKFCSFECREYYKSHRKEFLSEYAIKQLSEAGKKGMQTQKELRRSKNEIAFCKLCEEAFKNVLHNEAMFNGWDADVILPDFKVAVLWNGKWHYEKITEQHSVKQVQNRDKIKMTEIENFGYVPYVIKDLRKIF